MEKMSNSSLGKLDDLMRIFDGVFYEIDKKIEALEDSGSYNYDNHLKNEVIDRISNRLALLVKEELAALL